MESIEFLQTDHTFVIAEAGVNHNGDLEWTGWVKNSVDAGSTVFGALARTIKN